MIASISGCLRLFLAKMLVLTSGQDRVTNGRPVKVSFDQCHFDCTLLTEFFLGLFYFSDDSIRKLLLSNHGLKCDLVLQINGPFVLYSFTSRYLKPRVLRISPNQQILQKKESLMFDKDAASMVFINFHEV